MPFEVPSGSILELIPHRPPMVFVDAMIEVDLAHAVCTFAITERTACLRDGALPGIYAVEVMAQAVAAHIGAVLRWRGETPGGGYLVGVRDVILGAAGFAPGEVLEIEVAHTFVSDRLAMSTVARRTRHA